MPNNPEEKQLRVFLENFKGLQPLEKMRALGELKMFRELLGQERVNAIMQEMGVDLVQTTKAFVGNIWTYILGVSELAVGIEDVRAELDKMVQPVQQEWVGNLLLAHLRLEYIMDLIIQDTLKVAGNTHWLSQAKLGFWQKIQMLPLNSEWSVMVVTMLKEVNKLRNAYAHDIRFDILNFKSEMIEKVWDEEQCLTREARMSKLMELIEGCEVILLLQTSACKKQMEDVVARYPVLKKIIFKGSNGKTLYDIVNKI